MCKYKIYVSSDAKQDLLSIRSYIDKVCQSSVTSQKLMEKNPSSIEELLKIESDGKTVESILQEKILTIGENIKIRRFKRFEGAVAGYVHAGGKIGVLVNFDLSDKSVLSSDKFKLFSKDIAMQIAAANPGYLVPEEVPSEVPHLYHHRPGHAMVDAHAARL